MRGAGGKVRVVEIVGFYAHLDEGAHQRLQRVGVVVDAAQQHALAHHRGAVIDQPPAGRARGARQFARVIGVQRDIDGLVMS